jgi:hypothetical protein
MVALPSLLAFLLPLPAARGTETVSHGQNLKRHRAIRQLSLSRHLLIDVAGWTITKARQTIRAGFNALILSDKSRMA